MYKLESFKSVLKGLVSVLADTMKVEAAIIDSNYKLIASTDNYIIHKGTEVHSPSIDCVLAQGDVIVSQPGRMQACEGCRFQNQCPATLEILNSIKIENDPVGVISLSVFSAGSDPQLQARIKKFERQLHATSQLIANIIKQSDIDNQIFMWQQMLQATMNLSNEVFVCIDEGGNIVNHNSSATSLFNLPKLKGTSVYHLLPSCDFSEVIDNKGNSSRNLKIDKARYTVSGISVKNEDSQLAGAVIKLAPESTLLPAPGQSRLSPSAVSLSQIIGESASIRSLKTKVEKIADSISTVMITGETGTGKEMFARAIHFQSHRVNAEFIAINCAAIPETLLESELFGYAAGAFTGAGSKGKAGLLELANHGTLFMDEIGDLPMQLQAKLLRVLQEKTLRRVGGRRLIPLDVRVVAATNQDIEELVRKSRFREDLYYRLNVIPLHIPPLRDRKEDIMALAMHFLRKYARAFDKELLGFSDSCRNLLQQYPWPGNVRELENAVECAVNFEDGETVSPENLPEKVRHLYTASGRNLSTRVSFAEKDAIISALEKFGYDLKGKKMAAEQLGIGLRTLYRRLEKYNLMADCSHKK